MMTSKAAVFRTFAVLLSTLLVGALLGAAVLGSVVRHRLSSFYEFINADGFTEQMLGIIEPTDPGQADTLRVILLEHGERVEDTMSSSRNEILMTLRDL